MTCYIVNADGHDQLMADTDEELRLMAAQIGLTGPHKFEGGPLSHYDVEEAEKESAISKGAVMLDSVQHADMIRGRMGGFAPRRT